MKARLWCFLCLPFILLMTLACALPIFVSTRTPTPHETVPVLVTPHPEITMVTPAGSELPDLAYYYYSIRYDGCPWGGPGSITVRVKNIGSADAGPFDVEINDQIAHVDGVPAGGSVDAAVRFESGPIGHVDILINPQNTIQETDKANNQFSIVFTPPPPCATDTP